MPIKEIQTFLNNKRYDLETLREKPHIHLLRAVFELKEMLDVCCKKAQLEILLKKKEEIVEHQ